MINAEWVKWCMDRGFVVDDNLCGERAWSHSSGYGYTTLRLVWGRDSYDWHCIALEKEAKAV